MYIHFTNIKEADSSIKRSMAVFDNLLAAIMEVNCWILRVFAQESIFIDIFKGLTALWKLL